MPTTIAARVSDGVRGPRSGPMASITRCRRSSATGINIAVTVDRAGDITLYLDGAAVDSAAFAETQAARNDIIGT